MLMLYRISEAFSKSVSSLVEEVTEDKSIDDWKERKEAVLKHVSEMSQDALLVKSADLISNVNEILSDYEDVGESVFERFSAGRDDTITHYKKILTACRHAWKENPLLKDLNSVHLKLIKLERSFEVREEKDNERINLIPMFEAAFGTSKIDNKEDLDILIKALEEVGDVPFDEEVVKRVQELVKKEKEKRSNPTQCVFWKEPEEIRNGYLRDNFELLHTYYKGEHDWMYFLKCRECGQHYVMSFKESISWATGNDPQYSVYVPVRDREEADKVVDNGLVTVLPRLHKDFPSDVEEPKVYWVKEDKD